MSLSTYLAAKNAARAAALELKNAVVTKSGMWNSKLAEVDGDLVIVHNIRDAVLAGGGGGGGGGATPLPNGTVLAAEGEDFDLPTASVVSYGAAGSWIKTVVGAGSKTCGLDLFPGQLDPIGGVVKSCVVGDKTISGGGGTGGGTVGSLTSGQAATVARVKTAFNNAPSTLQALLTFSGTNARSREATGNAPVNLPGAAGNYARHVWEFRPGGGGQTRGVADLKTSTKVMLLDKIEAAFGGGTWLDAGEVQSLWYWSLDDGEVCVGMNFNGRAFGIACRGSGGYTHVEVNGQRMQPIYHQNNDAYEYVDFGSAASRQIVLHFAPGTQFGEFVCKAGDTITPYDWTPGKIRYNALADSWGATRDDVITHATRMQLSAALYNAHSLGGSQKGGTGYLAVSDQPNAMDASVRAKFAWGTPDIMDNQMFVNDNIDEAALPNAIRTVMANSRADNPNAILFFTCAVSQESRATPDSRERAKFNLIVECAQELTGPWAVINLIDGDYLTHTGATRPVKLGKTVTGEGSVESPTGSGNADLMFDNNSGRHPTDYGVQRLCLIGAQLGKEAVATM